MRVLGEGVFERLDSVPSHFKVIRHVRPKLGCWHCAAVSEGTPRACPPRPVARAIPTRARLAQVAAKSADQCPL